MPCPSLHLRHPSLIAMNPSHAQTRSRWGLGTFDAVSQSYPSARMPGLALVNQP